MNWHLIGSLSYGSVLKKLNPRTATSSLEGVPWKPDTLYFTHLDSIAYLQSVVFAAGASGASLDGTRFIAFSGGDQSPDSMVSFAQNMAGISHPKGSQSKLLPWAVQNAGSAPAIEQWATSEASQTTIRFDSRHPISVQWCASPESFLLQSVCQDFVLRGTQADNPEKWDGLRRVLILHSPGFMPSKIPALVQEIDDETIISPIWICILCKSAEDAERVGAFRLNKRPLRELCHMVAADRGSIATSELFSADLSFIREGGNGHFTTWHLDITTRMRTVIFSTKTTCEIAKEFMSNNRTQAEFHTLWNVCQDHLTHPTEDSWKTVLDTL